LDGTILSVRPETGHIGTLTCHMGDSIKLATPGVAQVGIIAHEQEASVAYFPHEFLLVFLFGE
jgi:hypothetical protein